MSLNYMRALQPVALIDPRIDYDTDETSTVGSDDNPQGMGDKYLVYRGPKNIEYFEIPPTSGDGNTSASTDFTYFMPSRESVLDKCLFLKANIDVEMKQSTDAVTSGFLIPGRFGLVAFPLHHCINILQLQIDGVSYTVDLQNSFRYLKYYSYTEDELKTYSSGSPVLLDNSSMFVETGSYNVLAAATDKTLNAVIPRGSFSLNSLKSFPGTASGPAYATASYTVVEPIYLSPLVLNAIEQSRSTGLTGLANIRIKITWKSVQDSFYYGFNYNPYLTAPPATVAASVSGTWTVTPNNSAYLYQKTVVGAAGTTVSNPSYELPTLAKIANFPTLSTASLKISSPTMLIGILTLPDTHISPSINSYAFLRYETHTESGVIPTGNPRTFTITSRNYNLSQIPHYVLFAVTPRIEGQVFKKYMGKTDIPINTIPENFYGTRNVNIKLGNRSGLLATCKSELLYLMDRNNGLAFTSLTESGMKEGFIGSFVSNPEIANTTNGSDATKTIGSCFQVPQGCPLLLAFGKDIALDDASLAPGVAVNTNFQVTLTCNNKWLNSDDEYTFTIIFVYNGIFTIGTTGSSYVVAPLSRDDVLNSESEQIDLDDLERGTGSALVGGSFFSKLKKIGKKVSNFVTNPKVQNFVKDVVRAASVAGIPGASQVDAMVDTMSGNGYRGSALGGGYVPRGGALGGTMVAGGNVLTAQQLRQRLAAK